MLGKQTQGLNMVGKHSAILGWTPPVPLPSRFLKLYFNIPPGNLFIPPPGNLFIIDCFESFVAGHSSAHL